ncbi:dihydroorotase [bacterium BMS3Bbin04]|nr:dihydroorotase [bacterium BMS3Bbin04]
MNTLIRGASCVFPDGIRESNILIEDGLIVDVDAPDSTSADQVVEAGGLHLLPGVIDDQVHFRDPGHTSKEDLRTATMACAKGGVTSFLEMPNTNPTTTTLEALDAKLDLAAEKSLVNYGFYIGATLDNLGELKAAKRTPGIKIFIGSSTGTLLVDKQEALEAIFAETTLPICAHCEDEATVQANMHEYLDGKESVEVWVHSKIRNHEAALIATKRAIDLSTRHNHRFHVLHMSTADEVPLIRAAKEAGAPVTAEVCPHHLFFNINDYRKLGSRIQMNPSIKTVDDNIGLWQGLLNGDVDLIATDHAPHTLEEKAQPYPKSPSGIPAIENSLMLMLDQVNKGACSLKQVVRWMCEKPAEVWSIANKGQIATGYDADLALVNLYAPHTILDENQLTKTKWSPWHGTTVRGSTFGTWVMGQRVFWMGEIDKSVRGGEIRYYR